MPKDHLKHKRKVTEMETKEDDGDNDDGDDNDTCWKVKDHPHWIQTSTTVRAKRS